MNQPDRAAWLAQRQQGIGASDIAAVLGISPWCSPLELYLRKRGEMPALADTPTLRRGRLLEPLVLDFYADETGHALTRQQEHVIDGWKMATLDAFDADAAAPVEAKTVNAFAAREFGEHGSDAVPLHYGAQVHWQVMLTGADRGYLAALIGSDDFRIFELRRDHELESLLIARASEFWQRVQDGRAPEPASEADVQLLYPRDVGTQITATPDIADDMLRLRGVREQIKTLEASETELTGRIKQFMGEHAALINAAGVPLATWKGSKPGRKTDWESLANAVGFTPEQLEQHTKPTPGTRRFLVKEH